MVEASAPIFLGLLVIISTSMKCDAKLEKKGCEPRWDSFKDKCYYAYKFPLYTYDEARTLCIAMGSALAKINDFEEDLYLKGYTEDEVNLWLGANNRENEGIWKWEDNTLMTYTNWKSGHPRNSVEHCLHYHDVWHAKWNDGQCDNLMGFICEKETLWTAGDLVCAISAVGLESGDIPNSQITASSTWSHDYRTYYGRLNYVGRTDSWRPVSNNEQWLQVDLGYERHVARVATQGLSYCCDQWVKTYHLKYYDDSVWKYVANDKHSPMTFQGNSDRNTIVYHNLGENSFISQFVRFCPLTWNGHIALRVEVYECK